LFGKGEDMQNKKQRKLDNNFIKTIGESSSSAVRMVEFINSQEGISFITPRMKKHVRNAIAGDVVAFIARPGHGKTTLMTTLALDKAKKLPSEDEDGVIIYVTWEQSVEVQEVKLVTDRDFNYRQIIDKVPGAVEEYKRRVVQMRPHIPIQVAGYSFDCGNSLSNKMTIPRIYNELVTLSKKGKVNLHAIFFDYLQKIPTEKRFQGRNLEIADAIQNAKNLAIDVQCPVFVGVQAKTAIGKGGNYMPSMGDTYYSGELDHVIDIGFGMMKPIAYYDEGFQMEARWEKQPLWITVDNNTFIMETFKQREGEMHRRFFFNFDMASFELRDIDFNKQNNNQY
jgi:replicative DNA helicase